MEDWPPPPPEYRGGSLPPGRAATCRAQGIGGRRRPRPAAPAARPARRWAPFERAAADRRREPVAVARASMPVPAWRSPAVTRAAPSVPAGGRRRVERRPSTTAIRHAVFVDEQGAVRRPTTSTRTTTTRRRSSVPGLVDGVPAGTVRLYPLDARRALAGRPPRGAAARTAARGLGGAAGALRRRDRRRAGRRPRWWPTSRSANVRFFERLGWTRGRRAGDLRRRCRTSRWRSTLTAPRAVGRRQVPAAIGARSSPVRSKTVGGASRRSRAAAHARCRRARRAPPP